MVKNILEYLEAAALRWPEKRAITSPKGSLTFAQLHTQARQIGTLLCRRGCRGRGVAVMMHKTPGAYASMLGVLYAGSWFVALDPGLPKTRLEQLLRTAQPDAILCDEACAALALRLDHPGKIVRCQETDGVDEKILEEVRREQLDVDPIYVVFTSGSGGTPKGVVGCHRAVIDYAEQLCPVLGIDEDTVFGVQAPLYVDAWLKELMGVLKCGATMDLIPKQLFLFPVKMVAYLNERGINSLCWVASALSHISIMNTFDEVIPKYLRLVAFASEVFPRQQLLRWLDAVPQARFFNLYGPTEATGVCCWYEVPRPLPPEQLPIGRPFSNTGIQLLGADGRAVSPGQPGEICIRGSCLTLGYCGDDPGGFSAGSVAGLRGSRIYRTGDMGRFNDRGELMFLGRLDRQFKHMGYRIEPGEIEAAALEMRGIHGCCLCYDPERKRMTLFYTGSATQEALADFLRRRLPRHMQPHRLRQLRSLPQLPNGKLDRVALRQKACGTKRSD